MQTKRDRLTAQLTLIFVFQDNSSDEEYVEWGVRLGKDPALRQQIAWQLRQSRQTAPLWNAKQFTRKMEKAYEEMWARYVEASG